MDSLQDVMELMKKRVKEKDGKITGGFGVGPKATAQMDDGIEARIQNLGRKKLTKAQLGDKDLMKDLAQMADRTAVIGEVALAKPAVKKKVGDKDPKDWAKWSEDMTKAARELSKELQKGDKADPDQVKTIASTLNGSCTDCHGKFRTND